MTFGLASKLPLTLNPSIPGVIDLIKTYAALVRQNLKLLVMTNPGEKIMDSNYGVGIKKYLFEQNNAATHDDIRAKIAEQISRYMSYVFIREILINKDEDEHTISVKIFYYIDKINIEDDINIILVNEP